MGVGEDAEIVLDRCDGADVREPVRCAGCTSPESEIPDLGEGPMSIRTIPLVVAASAAMVLAAPAVAKEIEEATVCGAGGCTKVTPRGDAHAMLEGGAVSDAPASAPFYRIRLGIGDGSGRVFERFSILYVPSADKVRAIDGQWMNTTTATERALDRVTRGHRPFPAKRLNTAPTEAAETIGTSLPPEIVTPGDDGPPSGSGGVSAWVIALAAGGCLALVGGGAAWALRRRPSGGQEAAIVP